MQHNYLGHTFVKNGRSSPGILNYIEVQNYICHKCKTIVIYNFHKKKIYKETIDNRYVTGSVRYIELNLTCEEEIIKTLLE